MLPVEIKSGKDYTVHSALDKFLATPEYHIRHAVVLSNEQKVFEERGITYLPIYYCMFLDNNGAQDRSELIVPDMELPALG